MHETQVIEKTSKELKQQMIYGVVTIIAGFFFLASNYVTAGLILFGLGVVWLIITKCRIWWYHE